jgi:hypothetical protein
MSGKRCKSLRADFFEQHGRYPQRARVVLQGAKIKGRRTKAKLLQFWNFLRSPRPVVGLQTSEWRRVKRAWTDQLRAAA